MIKSVDRMTLAMKRQSFSNITLFSQRQIAVRDRALRKRLTAHFDQGCSIDPRQLMTTSSKLLTRLDALPEAAISPKVMRDFYEGELERVVDIFSATRSPLVTSGQLSQLRQALVTWAFRLAGKEREGNLALVLGGSAANGVHTFLTDVDFIIIPHSVEDREPARNVQNMMAGLLKSIGIEGDGYLPNSFGFMTVEELGKKYLNPLLKAEAGSVLYSEMEGPFYRILMDARVIDSTGPTAVRETYVARIKALQDLLIFSKPKHMIRFCADSTWEILSTPPREGEKEIKKNPLHLFQLALYAIRARQGIRPSNYWRVLHELQKRNIITQEERETAFQSLCLFIELRHLLSFGLSEVEASTFITDKDLELVAQRLGISKQELSEQIELKRSELVEIARKIFSASRNS